MEAVYVVGAGGIGCAVGYALRAAGVPVAFVESNPAKVEAGRRGGVRVDDRPPLDADFVPFDDWKPVPGSWVLLCTKCYDNAAVLERLTVPVQLVPIQNGFDPRLQAFGHDHEGIASFVSECAPDHPHTRITRRGELHLGHRNLTPQPPSLGGKGGLSPPFPPREGGPGGLGSLLRTANLFRFVPVADIAPVKHAKLMYNAAISPLAAAAGIDNGQL